MKRYAWEEFNYSYGPWYRLRGMDNDGITIDLKVSGRKAEAIVQPDMDRRHWYWSVKFAAYRPRPQVAGDLDRYGRPKKHKKGLPEKRLGGKVDSVEEAKQLAIAAVMTGRPE